MLQLPIGKSRPVEDDVVGLPLSRRTRRIHQRRILSVHRARLPIGISLVLVGIEHLDFVSAHQKHAAVAALLAFSVGRSWLGELYVQLTIPEGIARGDIARLRYYFDVPALNLPCGRLAIFVHPLG